MKRNLANTYAKGASKMRAQLQAAILGLLWLIALSEETMVLMANIPDAVRGPLEDLAALALIIPHILRQGRDRRR